MNASITGRKYTRRSARPLIMALEPRIMFDGAAVVDAAHAVLTDAQKALIPVIAAPTVVREADPSKDNGKKEVAFVDTSVADYKTLEAGIRDGVEIVEINGAQSGLAQMAGWAETHSGYDAIHVLSHGSEATLHLGADLLTEAALSNSTIQAHGTKALISCLAVIYDYADRYRDNLQIVLSVLASHQIRPTKATAKSPMLPFVRLLIPKVDPKAASLYARALSHAAAEGVVSDELVEFVGKTGGIEACATQYTRSRRGEQTTAPQASRPIDKMRAIAASALPSTIPMPRENGLYILVVERRPNGEAVSYGCTDDPALVDRAASRIVRSVTVAAKK